MDRQPDDIRRYIRLTESSLMSSNDEDMIIEGIEVAEPNTLEPLLEEVNDMIFKLRSYSESDNNIDYARGVEEGLALAADMLTRLLERHFSHSIK